jgi:hypothetical protein
MPEKNEQMTLRRELISGSAGAGRHELLVEEQCVVRRLMEHLQQMLPRVVL